MKATRGNASSSKNSPPSAHQSLSSGVAEIRNSTPGSTHLARRRPNKVSIEIGRSVAFQKLAHDRNPSVVVVVDGVEEGVLADAVCRDVGELQLPKKVCVKDVVGAIDSEETKFLFRVDQVQSMHGGANIPLRGQIHNFDAFGRRRRPWSGSRRFPATLPRRRNCFAGVKAQVQMTPPSMRQAIPHAKHGATMEPSNYQKFLQRFESVSGNFSPIHGFVGEPNERVGARTTFIASSTFVPRMNPAEKLFRVWKRLCRLLCAEATWASLRTDRITDRRQVIQVFRGTLANQRNVRVTFGIDRSPKDEATRSSQCVARFEVVAIEQEPVRAFEAASGEFFPTNCRRVHSRAGGT